MQGDEKVTVRLEFHAVEDVRTVDAIPVIFDHLQDGIADDVDALARNAFAQQVGARPFRVWHQDVAAVVDEPAIDLLRALDRRSSDCRPPCGIPECPFAWRRSRRAHCWYRPGSAGGPAAGPGRCVRSVPGSGQSAPQASRRARPGNDPAPGYPSRRRTHPTGRDRNSVPCGSARGRRDYPAWR